jgi:hypothetical protein
MEDSLERLRRKYEGFRKGEEDGLAVRDEAHSVLAEARKIGARKVIDEVTDMLMDLEFSIEENKCKCHRKPSNC